MRALAWLYDIQRYICMHRVVDVDVDVVIPFCNIIVI